MTNDHPRARSIISTLATAFVIFAVFALVFGSIFLWAKAKPSARTEVTHTPRATVNISFSDNTHAEVLPTHEIATHTPVPDFASTQRALDDAVSTHQAAIETQMSEAANVATATELAHVGRMNEAEYNGAVAGVSSKIHLLNYEEQLHAEVISHTVEMQAVELKEQARYLNVFNTIRLIGHASWRALALVVAVTLMGWFFWFLYLRTVDEPEYYDPEPLRLEMVTADKKHTRFGMLPVSEDKFYKWAFCASKNQSIAYDWWIGQDKVFTRNEYDALMETMRDIGVVVYRDPDKPNLGQRVPAKWRAELRGYVERAAV